MTNSYIAGSLVRTIANFTDVNGNAADPTTTTLKYEAGNGAVQTPAPVHDSTGTFHYDLDTTGFNSIPNLWVIEWKGTGAVQAIAQDSFYVTAAPLG